MRILAITIILLFLSASAKAAQISILSGVENGTIILNQAGEDKSYAIGGLPLSVGLVSDLDSLPISVRYAGAMLIDFPNSQLSRLSLEIEAHYYLFGGPWKRLHEIGPVTVTNVNAQAIAVLFQTSYSNYNATSINNADVSISGSVLEARIGVSYSYQWSPTLCYDAELQVTAMSFHSSIDRIKPSMVAVLFGPRLLY